MQEFRADLHCHSTYSDGTLSPKELVDLALSTGLSALSVTDHDSVNAYPEVFFEGEKKGLKIISGAEFSAAHRKTSVHILAYGFSYQHPALTQLCERHKERRSQRNRLILEKLAALKMPITEEELLQENSTMTGRPHIALAMVKKGYVVSVSEAFKKYLGDGKACYASGLTFSVEETLHVIHEAKGLGVLAHPHLINNSGLVNELLEMPFDGLECFY